MSYTIPIEVLKQNSGKAAYERGMRVYQQGLVEDVEAVRQKIQFLFPQIFCPPSSLNIIGQSWSIILKQRNWKKIIAIVLPFMSMLVYASIVWL